MLLKSRQNFFHTLWEVGAVGIDTEKGFKLAYHEKHPRAPRSPIYLNFRTEDNRKPGPLRREHIESMACEMYQALMLEHVAFEAVAGIPNAGVPFAKAMHANCAKRIGTKVRRIPIYKRAANKDANGAAHKEPSSLRIESQYRNADPDERPRVTLIDDVITSATTTWRAIDALRRARWEPVAVAVWLDREQGGSRILRESGIRVVSVTTLSKMLEFYGKNEYINARDMRIIKEYLAKNRM